MSASEDNRMLPQYFAVAALAFAAVSSGNALGWTSPTLPQLQRHNSSRAADVQFVGDKRRGVVDRLAAAAGRHVRSAARRPRGPERRSKDDAPGRGDSVPAVLEPHLLVPGEPDGAVHGSRGVRCRRRSAVRGHAALRAGNGVDARPRSDRRRLRPVCQRGHPPGVLPGRLAATPVARGVAGRRAHHIPAGVALRARQPRQPGPPRSHRGSGGRVALVEDQGRFGRSTGAGDVASGRRRCLSGLRKSRGHRLRPDDVPAAVRRQHVHLLHRQDIPGGRRLPVAVGVHRHRGLHPGVLQPGVVAPGGRAGPALPAERVAARHAVLVRGAGHVLRVPEPGGRRRRQRRVDAAHGRRGVRGVVLAGHGPAAVAHHGGAAAARRAQLGGGGQRRPHLEHRLPRDALLRRPHATPGPRGHLLRLRRRRRRRPRLRAGRRSRDQGEDARRDTEITRLNTFHG